METQTNNTPQENVTTTTLYAQSSNTLVRDCRKPSDAEIAAFKAGNAFAAYRIEKTAHQNRNTLG